MSEESNTDTHAADTDCQKSSFEVGVPPYGFRQCVSKPYNVFELYCPTFVLKDLLTGYALQVMNNLIFDAQSWRQT
jgi:hypothetical protein